MNSPDEVLKAQRAASVWSGTKTVCVWLILANALVAVGSAFYAVKGKESVLGSVVTPLLLISILALLYAGSERKLRVLRAALSQ